MATTGTLSDDQFDKALVGGPGDDLYQGLEGDDWLLPTAGNDTLDGGPGRDVAIYSATGIFTAGVTINNTMATVDGVAPGTVVKRGFGTDVLIGVENFHGTNADDVIRLGFAADGTYSFDENGNDLVVAYTGDTEEGNYFAVGRGNDTFVGSVGTDTLDFSNYPPDFGLSLTMTGGGAGAAFDPWSGTDVFSGIEIVVGSGFSDSIILDDGDRNEATGGAGLDYLDGGSGSRDQLRYDREVFLGGFQGVAVDLAGGTAIDSFGDGDVVAGFEWVRGTSFDDTLLGDDGDNQLDGREGDDLIEGRAGHDSLEGRQGNDSLLGGDGDDRLRPGAGADVIDGGAGHDRLSYQEAAATGGILVTFTDATSGTVIDWAGDPDSFTGIEQVDGTPFDDGMTGAEGRQQLRGEDGNDTLAGGDGEDDLSGGPGDDLLIGGEGGDFLQPGAGNDTIDGGIGGVLGQQDELSYQYDEDATGGVTVAFTSADSGSVIDWSGGTDVFTGIEAVRGTHFDDLLVGADDNQRFRPNGGNDTIDGGAGDEDQLDYRDTGGGDGRPHSAVVVDMAAGIALDGFGGTDVFTNIERVRGSQFDDTLTGSGRDETIDGDDGNDLIDGGGGRNNLRGGFGDDRIFSRWADDWVEAGDGNDTISFDIGNPDIGLPGVDPGAGSDTILQAAGVEITLSYASLDTAVVIDLGAGEALKAGGNRDSFGVVHQAEGGRGDDTLLGSDRGYEAFVASFGSDVIDGLGGFDELRFTNRAETGVVVDMTAGTATGAYSTLVTFSNIEAIQGSRGADSVTGSSADEQFRMIGGADTIDGGGGIDRVSYDSDRFFGGLAGVTVDLAAGFAIDGSGDTDTLVNIEQAYGSHLDDTLAGDEDENRLGGAAGNDTLIGRGGNDTLLGADGDDLLDAGAGEDVLWGGAGNDTYVGGSGDDLIAGSAAHLDGDTVADFEAGDVFYIEDDAGDLIGANITTDGSFFYVDKTGDAVAEAVLVNASGYTGPVTSVGGPVGGGPSVPATIRLDEAGAIVTVLEGESGTTTATFTIRREGDLASSVTVGYAFEGFGSNPLSPSDTSGWPGIGNVTFAPGETEKTIAVGIAGDTLIEPDELARLSLTAVAGDGSLAPLLQPGTAVLRVVNDDTPPQVSVSGTKVAEGSGALPFTFTREGDLSQPLTVAWSLTAASGSRAASAGDLAAGLPQAGTITFAAGSAVAVLDIGIVNDSVAEFHESVQIAITGLSGPGAVGVAVGTATATGEIRNDDGIPAPVVGLDAGSYGDPHLVTLDGLAYEFQAVGEFTLLRATSGAPLEVQVRYSPVPGSELASQTTAVATQLGTARITIDLGRTDLVRVDGVGLDPLLLAGGLDVGDGQVFFDGEVVTIVYATGEQLRLDLFDGFINTTLTLAAGRRVEGLLGTADADPSNDLALPDGTVLPQPVSFANLYGPYADAWRVSDATSLFDYPAGLGTADFTDLGFPVGVLDLAALPDAVVAVAEALVAGIADPVLRDAALRDYLLSGNPDVILAAGEVPVTPVVEIAPEAAPVALAGVGVIVAESRKVEGDDGATTLFYTLWRTGDLSAPLDLHATLTGSSGLLIGLSASFAAGEDVIVLPVDVPADRLAESDETLVFQISAPGGGVLLLGGQATALLIDDDFAPVAVADAATVAEGGSLLIDVLANDSDADGDPLSIAGLATSGTVGVVTIEGGQVRYDAAAAFDHLQPGEVATDRFLYSVTDGFGNTATAEVTVTITGAEDRNVILGTKGSNSLRGTSGDDIFFSLGGRNDQMRGMAGADAFVFGAETRDGERGRDTILDYTPGEDVIVLSDGASILSVRDTIIGVTIVFAGDRDVLTLRGASLDPSDIAIETWDTIL